VVSICLLVFFFSSRRRHTRSKRDWSSDVCSSDLPLLAEDYEVDDESKNFTFFLRDDVEFTDGEKFNAEAVKANFERIIDSEGSINGYKSLRNVEDIEVVDDYEVKITLD